LLSLCSLEEDGGVKPFKTPNWLRGDAGVETAKKKKKEELGRFILDMYQTKYMKMGDKTLSVDTSLGGG